MIAIDMSELSPSEIDAVIEKVVSRFGLRPPTVEKTVKVRRLIRGVRSSRIAIVSYEGDGDAEKAVWVGRFFDLWVAAPDSPIGDMNRRKLNGLVDAAYDSGESPESAFIRLSRTA